MYTIEQLQSTEFFKFIVDTPKEKYLGIYRALNELRGLSIISTFGGSRAAIKNAMNNVIAICKQYGLNADKITKLYKKTDTSERPLEREAMEQFFYRIEKVYN